MNEGEKPSRIHREWLRLTAWPFQKRPREGADSVMPHLEEFREQATLLGKRPVDQNRESKSSPDREKPPH